MIQRAPYCAKAHPGEPGEVSVYGVRQRSSLEARSVAMGKWRMNYLGEGKFMLGLRFD